MFEWLKSLLARFGINVTPTVDSALALFHKASETLQAAHELHTNAVALQEEVIAAAHKAKEEAQAEIDRAERALAKIQDFLS